MTMDFRTIMEIVGYIGSAFVVISMLMTSVMKLRIFNTTGSIISAIYAIIVHAYPLALMNILLIIINIWRMMSLKNQAVAYQVVEEYGTSAVSNYLVNKYLGDIRKFFPDFNGLKPSDKLFVVYNGDTAVGVTAGSLSDDGSLNLFLDYTTPAYRDCSVGNYIYKQMGIRGVHELLFENPSDVHAEYLRKVGFTEADGKFIKKLK